MEFDNSWRAVFNPAVASEYFSPPPPSPLAPVSRFNVVNAWWLAELSRLVYRDDPKGGEQTRDRFLAAVGLTESHFFSHRSTEAALVEPRGEARGEAAALVFRGTDGPVDWNTNARLALTTWPQGGTVHAGFQKALDDIWPAVEKALDGLAMPVFYAGHSLGGALATLAASRRPPVAVYTFGGPRVGNAEFAEAVAEVAVYRVVNRRDTVPATPLNIPGMRYHHAGQLRGITTGKPRKLVRKKDGRLEARFPPLPGERRWHDPPPNLCDHAPVNYVACLERIASGQR